MKLALCIGCFLFFAFGISEMHVQKCPVHNFYAEKIYPPIESPLHNNDGDLKVTDAEYVRAKYLAWEEQNGVRGEQMYQLERYCEGRIHIRSDAKKALSFLRSPSQEKSK